MFNPARLVFIDETSTNTAMVRLRGRCPRGERLIGRAPQGHWKTITFVAGLRHDKMVAPFVIDGPMTRANFLAYIEQGLGSTLKRGDIVIFDNLPPTKVLLWRRLSNLRVPGCFICRNTRQISIQSNWPSVN